MADVKRKRRVADVPAPAAVDSPRRGRPRAYDPETALDAATAAFWHGGFSGTSLDDLGVAAGMNRPSLYAAFGDKKTLYLQTLARYVDLSLAAMRAELGDDRPLADSLGGMYAKAISIYRPRDGDGRGCFLVGTAATEAVADADVRDLLQQGLRALDGPLEERFRRAVADGELDDALDVRERARIASAVMHSLAIRARAGDSRESLRTMGDAAVALLAPAPATSRRRR